MIEIGKIRKTVKALLIVSSVVGAYMLLMRLIPLPEAPAKFSAAAVEYLQSFGNPTLDLIMTFSYIAFYPLLVYGVGLVLGVADWSSFKKYVATFAVAQAFAVFVWMVYPVAPPKYAYSSVADIRGVFMGAEYVKEATPFLYGAFPSMHVVNGILAVTYLKRLDKRWLYGALPMFLAMGFSTIYLGEHYVLDVLIAPLFAGLSIGIVESISRIMSGITLSSTRRRKRKDSLKTRTRSMLHGHTELILKEIC